MKGGQLGMLVHAAYIEEYYPATSEDLFFPFSFISMESSTRAIGGLGGEKVDAGSCVDCLDISIVLFDFFFFSFSCRLLQLENCIRVLL